MITCPFCDKPVHLSKDERDSNSLLADTDTDDFYCPTYVDTAPGRRQCHYQRTTRQGWYPDYHAIIPPFRIHYVEGESITVFTIEPGENSDITTFNLIYEDKVNPTFEAFVKMYHRFKTLRAFI